MQRTNSVFLSLITMFIFCFIAISNYFQIVNLDTMRKTIDGFTNISVSAASIVADSFAPMTHLNITASSKLPSNISSATTLMNQMQQLKLTIQQFHYYCFT
ncbi:MAG: hypothetical protein KBG92_05990 [Spirochaetes bacterium]|nr:hypothetical protein [Spirochaetota bacterium]HQL44043.1 hypothetical protein [Spirochaetota bacterium]